MTLHDTRRIALWCLIVGSMTWGTAALAAQTSGRPPPASLSVPVGRSVRVDARGFIRRWLVLEPRRVGGALTEDAVNATVLASALPDPPDALPRDGALAGSNGTLRWHALESRDYNFNLYHFAWSLSQPTSNVLFWVVVAVDAPAEMHDVRLAIGSNAASRWWLNGEQVISIYGDRQTVIDDGVSRRLVLHKGRNLIRAAIINGGGATDFCARFLDAHDQPVTTLMASLEPQ